MACAFNPPAPTVCCIDEKRGFKSRAPQRVSSVGPSAFGVAPEPTILPSTTSSPTIDLTAASSFLQIRLHCCDRVRRPDLACQSAVDHFAPPARRRLPVHVSTSAYRRLRNFANRLPFRMDVRAVVADPFCRGWSKHALAIPAQRHHCCRCAFNGRQSQTHRHVVFGQIPKRVVLLESPLPRCSTPRAASDATASGSSGFEDALQRFVRFNLGKGRRKIGATSMPCAARGWHIFLTLFDVERRPPPPGPDPEIAGLQQSRPRAPQSSYLRQECPRRPTELCHHAGARHVCFALNVFRAPSQSEFCACKRSRMSSVSSCFGLMAKFSASFSALSVSLLSFCFTKSRTPTKRVFSFCTSSRYVSSAFFSCQSSRPLAPSASSSVQVSGGSGWHARPSPSPIDLRQRPTPSDRSAIITIRLRAK